MKGIKCCKGAGQQKKKKSNSNIQDPNTHTEIENLYCVVHNNSFVALSIQVHKSYFIRIGINGINNVVMVYRSLAAMSVVHHGYNITFGYVGGTVSVYKARVFVQTYLKTHTTIEKKTLYVDQKNFINATEL